MCVKTSDIRTALILSYTLLGLPRMPPRLRNAD